jgi:hypothetical protein
MFELINEPAISISSTGLVIEINRAATGLFDADFRVRNNRLYMRDGNPPPARSELERDRLRVFLFTDTTPARGLAIQAEHPARKHQLRRNRLGEWDCRNIYCPCLPRSAENLHCGCRGRQLANCFARCIGRYIDRCTDQNGSRPADVQRFEPKQAWTIPRKLETLASLCSCSCSAGS